MSASVNGVAYPGPALTATTWTSFSFHFAVPTCGYSSLSIGSNQFAGGAWFDDISVTTTGNAASNLISNPGFETVTGAIPSTSYTVTAWCYVAAGTATLGAGTGTPTTTTTTGGWRQIQNTGSSDANGNLFLSLSSSATTGTFLYWDDVTVSAVEPANPVATWAQTFGYDGFGNLLSETPTAGSAPHLNINVDTTTNRVVATGVQYDAAGNMINDGTQAYTFDEANRLKTAGSYNYTYSGLENKRVIAYNGNGSTPSATINLYSPDGKRLGHYGFWSSNGWSKTNNGSFQNFLYLGNKALTYTEDRIGSTGNYFPYGNGYNVTGPEAQAFGTYVQDESGLLYADQRYYTAGFGRFMTADRSNANIDYGNPTSWNRYAYTNGDPVNGMDPTGRECLAAQFGNDEIGYTDGYVDDGAGSPCSEAGIDENGDISPYTLDVSAFDPLFDDSQLGPNDPNSVSATIDWDKFGSCLVNSTLDYYGLTALTAGSAALAVPIPKSLIPPFRMIGKPTTNLLSALGHYIEINVRRITIDGLARTNLLRIAGRANPYVAAALLAIDVGLISSATYQCYETP